MRTVKLDLNLEELEVETTVIEPVFAGREGLGDPNGYLAASILWNTLTEPISADTNSSPCIA